jgi:hypothetical protein
MTVSVHRSRRRLPLPALLLLAAALPLLAGCATSPYWTNRGRDAADVLTATLGTGAGVKCRVGPIQAAAWRNSDLVGLRGGQFLSDGNRLLENAEIYAPIPFQAVRKGRKWNWCGQESFSHGSCTVSKDRCKDSVARSPVPLIAIGETAPFYAQVELGAGVLFTLRLGINFGELADLVAGFWGADLYGDDIER